MGAMSFVGEGREEERGVCEFHTVATSERAGEVTRTETHKGANVGLCGGMRYIFEQEQMEKQMREPPGYQLLPVMHLGNDATFSVSAVCWLGSDQGTLHHSFVRVTRPACVAVQGVGSMRIISRVMLTLTFSNFIISL